LDTSGEGINDLVSSNNDPVAFYVFLGVTALFGFVWAFFGAGLWRRGWGFVFCIWGGVLLLELIAFLVIHVFTHTV